MKCGRLNVESRPRRFNILLLRFMEHIQTVTVEECFILACAHMVHPLVHCAMLWSVMSVSTSSILLDYVNEVW